MGEPPQNPALFVDETDVFDAKTLNITNRQQLAVMRSAIRRRIPEFRLHPCCFEYSLFLRSHGTSFIASVEHLGAFEDDHKKRYSPVFSQRLWGGKHLVFDLYSCNIAPSSFG